MHRDDPSPSSADSTSVPSVSEIANMLSGHTIIGGLQYQLPTLDEFPNYEGWGLLVSVEGVEFEYQFTRDDLQKVFQRYGRLNAVDTLSPQFPFGRVWFQNRHDAEVAISDLDNKVLNGIHGRLRVVWDPYSIQKLQEPQSSSPSSHMQPPTPTGVRKYTCRFDIGIENDKEFQVARKIIGQKVNNAKRLSLVGPRDSVSPRGIAAWQKKPR